MAVRYATVLLTSMGVQSLIFHVGVERLGLYDNAVFVVADRAVAALWQYFGHRFVSFNVGRFEKTGAGDRADGDTPATRD